jgi:cobalt-zinc-cadmium resistance protein CzcA
VEQTMATIPRITEMRSFSRFGLSIVTIVFTDETDVYWARQQVNERLIQARSLIPAGSGVPELAPLTTGLGEIYQYILQPKKGFESKYSAEALRTIQDWIIRRQLLGTEGVAEINSWGGYLKQYEVAVDPEKLRSMKLSIDDIFLALEKNNQNVAGAYLDRKPFAYFIRSEGLLKTTDDIENVVVKSNVDGMPVLIRNVAVVRFGHANRYGAMTYDDQGEVVGAIVMMLKGANSSRVIHNVKERISQIEKTLPEGVEIIPYLDRTKLVNSAIQTITKNLAEGALIVVLVLVFLLGDFRAGLIVASVIPLAMLVAVILMNRFGVSGNLMSLGAIDFGLIVDGAVIVVEATLHQITIPGVLRDLSPSEMDEQVLLSAKRMMRSAAFGQLIILIVYLPILTLTGIEGKMFRPMAQTVAFAIAGALLLSLTYVPMISSLLLRRNTGAQKNASMALIGFVRRLYDPVIRFALKKRALVIILSLGLFITGLVVFFRLGG